MRDLVSQSAAGNMRLMGQDAPNDRNGEGTHISRHNVLTILLFFILLGIDTKLFASFHFEIRTTTSNLGLLHRHLVDGPILAFRV